MEKYGWFRSIFEKSHIGIVVVGTDGVVCEWNPAMETITGYPAGDFVGRFIWDLEKEYHLGIPFRSVSDRRSISDLMSSVEYMFGMPAVFSIPRKDGEKRIVVATLIPIQDQPGFVAILVHDQDQHGQIREIRQQIRRLEALQRLSAFINQQTGLTRLLEEGSAQIYNALDVAFCAVYLFDRQEEFLELACIHQESRNEPGSATKMKFPRAFVEELRQRTGGILIMQDVQMFADWFPPGFLQTIGYPSIIACPLEHENRLIGVLVVGTDMRRFSRDDVVLMKALASQLAVGIVNTKLLEVSIKQSKRLEILFQITQTALEKDNLNKMLDVLAQQLVREMGAISCFIEVWDVERDIPKAAAACGPGSEEFLKQEFSRGDQTLAGKALESWNAMFFENLSAAPYQHRLDDPELQDAALLVLPLRVGEQKLGAVLAVFKREHNHQAEFSPFDDNVRIWEEMAAQISLAVQKVCLLDEERRNSQEAEAIQRATSLAASDQSIETILTGIQQAMDRVIPNDVIFINEVLGSDLLRAYSMKVPAYLDLPGIRETVNSIQDTIVYYFLNHPQPWIAADIQQYPGPQCKIVQVDPNIHSWMGVPMDVQGQRIGYLTLFCQEKDVYDKHMAGLALAFAGQAAIAIEKNHLFEENQNQTRYLQALNQITQLALSSNDLQTMLDTLARETTLALGTEGCYISLWNEEKALPYPVAAYGAHASNFMSLQARPGQPTISKSVLDSGHAIFIENYSSSPFYDPTFAFTQIPHAFLGLPLMVGNQKQGAVLLEFAQAPTEFQGNELDRWENVSSQVSLAVQKLILFKEERRRRHEAEVLQQVSTLVAQGENLEETLDGILEGVNKIIQLEIGAITKHAKNRMMETLVVFPKSAPSPFGLGSVPISDGFRQAYEDETVLLLDDAAVEPGPSAPVVARNPHLHSVLSVSMVSRGEILGTITLASHRIGQFSNRDANALKAFADQASIAFENDRLFRLSRHQEKHLQMLNALAIMSLESQNMDSLLQSVAQFLVENLPVSNCFISLWDETAQAGIPKTAYGPLAPIFLKYQPNQADLSLTVQLLEQRKPFLIRDISRLGISSDYPSFGENAALLLLPLIVGEQKLGSVTLYFSIPNEEITEDSLADWEKVSSQLSLAVYKSMLYEQEKQRRQEAETLQEALMGMNSSLDLQRLLDKSLLSLSKVVEFDNAGVLLLEDDHYRVLATLIRQPNDAIIDLIKHTYPRDEGFLYLLESEDSEVIINDVRNHPLYRDDIYKLPFSDVKVWAAFPLKGRSGRIGAMTLFRIKNQPFEASEIKMAHTFASQLVNAIENAQLFEQVRQGRERLQHISRKLVDLQENERRNLARELHDEIGQQLTGLIFGLERIRRGGENALQAAVAQSQGQVRLLMDEVREMSMRLRPTVLDDLGLQPGLEWFIRRYEEQMGIHVHAVYVQIEQRFELGIETTAFRVIQEALTNVARYAEVNEVHVHAGYHDGFLIIEVSDQGKGFDPKKLNNQGLSIGITGMEERTELVGGLFELYSELGKGTRIRAVLPVDRPVERRQSERKSSISG